MSTSLPSRNYELDRLRAFAILITIWAHLKYGFAGFTPPWWLADGNTGVDLFFVISGYIISKTLAPFIDDSLSLTGSQNRIAALVRTVGSFYIRRYFRLLPLCYFWLAAAAFAGGYFYSAGNVPAQLAPANLAREILAITLFGHSFFTIEGGHFALSWHWSLAVEEQYYFIYPLFLITVAPKGARIKYLAVGILLTTFVLRPLFAGFHFPSYYYRHASFLRFDCVMAGCLVYFSRSLGWEAILRRHWKLGPVRSWIFGLSSIFVMILIPSSLGTESSFSVKYPFALVVSTFLVALASIENNYVFPSLTPAKGFSHRTLAWLGTRSYALYLAHVPVLYLNKIIWAAVALRTSADTGPLSVLGFLILLGIAAELSHRAIEIPGSLLGRHFSSRWASARNRSLAT